MTRDLVILIAILVPAAALAQAQIPPPKAFMAVDANGVDLTSGTMLVNAPTIAIGPQDGGLVYSRSLDTTTNIWRDNYIGTVNTDPLHPVPENPTVTVTVMGQTIRFSQLSSGYEPVDDYAALTKSGTTWTLTLSDGTVALFSQTLASSGIYTANGGRITSLTRPNGEVLTFTYATAPTGVYDQYRLQSVTTNRGYQLHFDYAANGSPWTTDWDRVTTVTALNNAYDACAPTALSCSYSRTWPNLVFGAATNEQNVTDALLRTTRYNFNGVGANGGLLIGIRKPSNSGSLYDLAIGWTFDTPSQAWRVTSVTNRDNRTWSYAYGPGPSDPPPSDYTTTVTTTDPLTHTQVVGIQSMQFDTTTSHRVTRIAHATNGVNKTTTYDNHGVLYKIKRITQPEGDRVDYGFDPRGNITSAVRTNKAGSATISQGATYPGTCVSPDNPKTCNKPITVTDGRGAVTDFTYDTTHGGVLTVTAPAPTSGAVRPQTRYSYGSGYAWYKYAGGPIAQGPSPITVPTGTSACATLTTCAGGSDEVKTTIAYEAGSGSVATNLLPISTTSGDGAGTLSATTAMTYNARSDVITVDGPIVGAADTTRSFFDSMRQKNGEIRADPDGGGTLLFPATRTTFNLDGQVSLVETGTTANQTDMASFAMLEQTQTDYDLIGRKAKASFYGGGATQTVSEFGYDIANRLTCSTVRMNPSTFGLSPDACTLRTAGSDGPDRITYTSYDNANRPTQVQSGYGTAAVRTEQTTTYTDNGKEQTVADGKSNLTTYEYDGFDRLQKVRYPNATGSGSSTTDFDLYGYDANDNRTSWQRRGQTSPIIFSFDALNR